MTRESYEGEIVLHKWHPALPSAGYDLFRAFAAAPGCQLIMNNVGDVGMFGPGKATIENAKK